VRCKLSITLPIFYDPDFFVLGPPDEPSMVALDVTGTTSVNVRFQEPDFQDVGICTKFKCKWTAKHTQIFFTAWLSNF
jgi:hypothetical protein